MAQAFDGTTTFAQAMTAARQEFETTVIKGDGLTDDQLQQELGDYEQRFMRAMEKAKQYRDDPSSWFLMAMQNWARSRATKLLRTRVAGKPVRADYYEVFERDLREEISDQIATLKLAWKQADEQQPRQVGITSNAGGDIHIDHSPMNIAGRDVVVNNYPSHNPRQKRDRQALLSRCSIRIRDVFEQSLEGAAFIPLGLYDRPDLVENQLVLRVQETKQVAHKLPPDIELKQVYDEAAEQLLILGKPGSGKTTLLLRLANELLDHAKRDEALRIPVVFNLSAWADKRQPLADWLVEELKNIYHIPSNVGKPWVDMGEVLPFLDGLDEVAEEHRVACVRAINAYRQTHGQIPLVVGSRLAEYSALPTRLALQRAVFVRSMTLPQIHEYLEKAEGQLDALQELVDNEPDFQELAKNPFMLTILTRTYQGKKVQTTRKISLDERRHQIFNDYVESVFGRGSVKKRYEPEKTKKWLIWLASQMRRRSQTGFYLERLQLDWLVKSRPAEIYTSLAFALFSFPVAAIVYGLEYSIYGLKFALVNGTLAGLTTALIAFFFVWFIEADIRMRRLFPEVSGKTKPIEESKNRSKLATFLSQFLVERVGFALLSGLLQGMVVEFLVGPFYSLINGVFVAAFLVVLGRFEKEIEPAETLVWSWESVWKHALESFLQGFAIGVLGGMVNALPYLQHMSVFLATLCFWLSLGAALGVIIMFMRGFSSDKLNLKLIIKPNQGIRNSLSKSLRLGLSSGTLLGLVVFFFYSYVIHNVFVVGYVNELPTDVYIIYGVGDAVAVAYLFWLINGGFATVQHFVLRVLLWRTGCTPWRDPRFLDYASERILLRKIGGGYTFIHKFVLDYFANLGMEEGLRPTPAESQQSETTLSILAKSSDSEEGSTVPIPLPLLSDTARVLPCGHGQRDPQERFCDVCGMPIAPEFLE